MATRGKVTADRKQMLSFKKFFHGEAPAFYQALSDSKAKTGKTQQVFGTFKTRAHHLIDANANGAGIFMCINQLKGKLRTNTEVNAINAVFIDADGTMTLDQIKKLRPAPHLVVKTSPGRFHAYWRVSGLKVKDFRSVQQALARRFGTDASVCDPARVMRMPGTLHHKGKPLLATILRIKSDALRLTLTQLQRCFDLDLNAGAAVVRAVEVDEGDGPIQQSKPPAPEIRSALCSIPAAHDRDTWLRVGMAVHDALPTAKGFDLWTEWSRRAPSAFSSADQAKNWNSFKRKSGGVTVRTLFKLARDSGWQSSKRENTTAIKTAFDVQDVFVRLVKGRLLLDPTQRKWMVFEQPTWRVDDAKATQVARQVVETMLEDATSGDEPASAALIQRCANPRGVRQLLQDAGHVPTLIAAMDQMDQRASLLAVKNGVVDLQDGSFRQGTPDDLLVLRAPTAYDESATCPTFRKFIKFVTCGQSDYAKYLQRALGYTLFGHTDEQKLFIAYGDTRNGKGTLFRAMMHVLGAYVTAVAPNLLSKAYSGNPQGPSPAIMALRGSRMYQCSEGEDRHRFDTAFIKQISGSDPLTGRGNFSDQCQFTPVGKLWLAANHIPEVPQQDEAMWRRMQYLPFEAKVTKPIKDFENQLRKEASGILNWLIKGAVDYHKHGLGECDAVVRATAEARGLGDQVATWIQECCVQDKLGKVQSSAAYDSYRKYCTRLGVKPLSIQRFGRALVEKAFPRHDTKRCNGFRGLAIRVP